MPMGHLSTLQMCMWFFFGIFSCTQNICENFIQNIYIYVIHVCQITLFQRRKINLISFSRFLRRGTFAKITHFDFFLNNKKQQKNVEATLPRTLHIVSFPISSQFTNWLTSKKIFLVFIVCCVSPNKCFRIIFWWDNQLSVIFSAAANNLFSFFFW